jgi:hypothetical protein
LQRSSALQRPVSQSRCSMCARSLADFSATPMDRYGLHQFLELRPVA